MRAIAFCVSVRHAEFMAEQFKAAGLAAVAVTGGTDRDVRQAFPAGCARGDIQIVCTCDLYNEGVDLPDVNTLLLLRPTQSPVLFEQQLGRGLRLAPGQGIVPRPRLCRPLSGGVPLRPAPPGHDRAAEAAPDRGPRARLSHPAARLPYRLRSRRRRAGAGEPEDIARQTWPRLTRELQGYAAMKGPDNVSLARFLNDQALELSDIYRANRRWRVDGPAPQRGACSRGSVGAKKPISAVVSRIFSICNDPFALKLWHQRAMPRGELDDHHAQAYPDARLSAVPAHHRPNERQGISRTARRRTPI